MRFGPPPASIWKINLRFLYATFLFGLAWIYWPSSPEWWFFKVLSVLLVFTATVTALKAVIRIAQHLKQDRDVARFADQGAAPKGDGLASRATQRRAGMIDE